VSFRSKNAGAAPKLTASHRLSSWPPKSLADFGQTRGIAVERIEEHGQENQAAAGEKPLSDLVRVVGRCRREIILLATTMAANRRPRSRASRASAGWQSFSRLSPNAVLFISVLHDSWRCLDLLPNQIGVGVAWGGHCPQNIPGRPWGVSSFVFSSFRGFGMRIFSN